MDKQNSFSKIFTPEKMEDFQMMMIPPEAPIEGMNSKASKVGGQILLINIISKEYFFVSWRQITSQLLSTTLSLTTSHFFQNLFS
jgi:hypothetical protein